MSVIDEIKDRIDIVEVIGESVKLRKSGKNFTGFCPFHPNTRTPAFVIFPESGTWRCFGACNEGGDVFSFVMKKEGWDFREALQSLARRAGVELRPATPEQQAAEETQERIRGLLELALTFYRHNLLQTSAGAPVLDYLHGRGLSDQTLENFEIGYAPHSWDETIGYLIDKGYTREELSASGMVSERDDGEVYDRFRNRIMIPIRNARGRLAGFGARIVNPEDVPKFLNSPQTALFDKGRLLYGLDKARKTIRTVDQAVIVEGYLDVVALHQAGFSNAVSPMGTALTEHQLRQLKRYSRRVVLALDADLAGSQATLRGLSVAREALDREPDPVFDARGLVRHEGRLDADIRVISLPEGKDPDEVVAEDPSAWPVLLENAQPVVDYVLDVLCVGQDLDDPKAKKEIARQVLPLIEDVVDRVEREAYRQNLARRLKVDERALISLRPISGRRRPARRDKPAGEYENQLEGVLGARKVSPIERFCLGVLLREPELMYRIDRQLQSLDLQRLSPTDFTETEHQVIFQAVREALAQDEDEPAHQWRLRLEEPVIVFAEDLLAGIVDLDFGQPKVIDEILANFLRLRRRNLELFLQHIRFELQAVQEDEPGEDQQEDVWRHTREVQRVATLMERLDRALAHQGGLLPSKIVAQGR
jgi:DNA primase